MAEQAAAVRPERLRAEGRGPAAEVGLAEVGVPDAGHAEGPSHQAECGPVRDGAEDEVGVFEVRRDQAPAGGLDGRVDGLDRLLRQGEVGPGDGVDVSDLPHGGGPSGVGCGGSHGGRTRITRI